MLCPSSGRDYFEGLGPQGAVDELIEESRVRWMKEEQVVDDTTICIAFLDVPQPGQGGGK